MSCSPLNGCQLSILVVQYVAQWEIDTSQFTVVIKYSILQCIKRIQYEVNR